MFPLSSRGSCRTNHCHYRSRGSTTRSVPRLRRFLMDSPLTAEHFPSPGPPSNGGRWALTRYVIAATLVRSADGGAVVAIVLLATASGLPGWVSGLPGAAITAPHLLGPFIARRLDTAADGRKVIAFAALMHGILLAAAALLLPISWAARTLADLLRTVRPHAHRRRQ